MLCEACLGEGRIEYGRQNSPDADYTLTCEACNGDRWVEVEVEPLTEEDVASLETLAPLFERLSTASTGT